VGSRCALCVRGGNELLLIACLTVLGPRELVLITTRLLLLESPAGQHCAHCEGCCGPSKEILLRAQDEPDGFPCGSLRAIAKNPSSDASPMLRLPGSEAVPCHLVSLTLPPISCLERAVCPRSGHCYEIVASESLTSPARLESTWWSTTLVNQRCAVTGPSTPINDMSIREQYTHQCILAPSD
jgi:hypothetical protein